MSQFAGRYPDASLDMEDMPTALMPSVRGGMDELPTLRVPAVAMRPRPRPAARPSDSDVAPLTATAKRRAINLKVNLGVLSAIASLASATLVARGVGTFNQVVISDHFGAGAAMDAYFAAVAGPTLFATLVVSALESAVIPTYTKLVAAGREREASDVMSTLLNLVMLLLTALTAAMVVFPQYTVLAFAPGLPRGTVAIGVTLVPWILPTMMLNTYIGFTNAVLNATRTFALPAFAVVVVPIAMLVATLVLGATLGIVALALGSLVGTVLQCLIMLALVRGARLRYRPVLGLGHRDVRLALRQFWPMLAGAMIAQANPVVDQMVASALGTGGISWLNYATKITSIPVSVIFVAGGRAVFPYFSRQVADRDFDGLKKTLRFFCWLIGLITLATSLVFIVLARPIVAFILRHGAFSAHDAAMTAAVLVGFSLGLCPMALGFMIPRVFNAMHRSDVLFKAAAATMALNVALDILLAQFFGVPGIAIGTSLDYLWTTVVLILVLRGIIGPLGLLRPPAELLHPRRLASQLRGAAVNRA
jgi:putative peptidoglycan lipid II flippase